MSLENFLNNGRKFAKDLLLAGALTSSLILPGCNKDKGENNEISRIPGPNISQIEDLIVDEGEYVKLYLDDYVFDPEGNSFSIEKTSGPGTLWYCGFPTINGHCFEYTDQEDSDMEDNSHVVRFEAVNEKGGKSYGSFNLIQFDRNPRRLFVVSETMSSGLGVITLDSIFGTQIMPVAINNIGEPLVFYTNDAFGLDGFYTGSDNIYVKPSSQENIWLEREINTKADSVVIDDAGDIHISSDPFTATEGENLYYTKVSDSSIESTLIDSGPSAGLESDIALDSDNNSHISYFSWATDELRYATNVSGAWVTENLDFADWNRTSIVVDEEDNVHIAYALAGQVKYITNASGDWVAEIVGYGRNPDLRMDGQGLLHLAFNNSGFANGWDPVIYHSCRDNDVWNTETVASYGGVYTIPRKVSMALDSNDSIYIAYILYWGGIPYTSQDLYLANNKSGNWENLEIDDSPIGKKWETPLIEVDDSDNFHITAAYKTGPFLESQYVVKYIKFNSDEL